MTAPERPGPERPGPEYPPEWDLEPDETDETREGDATLSAIYRGTVVELHPDDPGPEPPDPWLEACT